MNESLYTLQDGTKLNIVKWHVADAKAHLLLVHGYAEHAGRYDDFAKNLNSRGISVTAYDQRGYGKSDGARAYIHRFHQYILDLREVRSTISEQVFLMGHSMGGLVVVEYALTQGDEDLLGLISSSGALELDPNLSPILQRLAPILGALFPKLKTEKLDKTYLTRSPAVKEAYMADTLNYLEGTRARTGAEMLKAIKRNSGIFQKISLPLLVLHGDGDRLTMPGGSRKLHRDANSEDKTLHLYPGLYHELIHEPEKDRVMEDIGNWISSRQ